MSDDQHPPTARPGIKATMKAEHAAAEKHPAGEVAKVEPPASAPADSGLNPTVSQSAAPDDGTAPTVVFSDAEDLTWPDAGGTSDERKAFLRESVRAYRNVLVGLRTRVQGEIANGYGGSLNPEGLQRAALETKRTIRLGIAKANQLLVELGENDIVEP